MHRGSRIGLGSKMFLGAMLALNTACDKATLPRMGFDRPPANVAPLTMHVVLDPGLQRAMLEQEVCDNQVWQGALGPTLAKRLQETGQTRIRKTMVTTNDGVSGAESAAPGDYHVVLRLLHQELVAKDRVGSTDQYQARLDIELAATYQAVLADGSLQTLGEGPLRFSRNFGIFTPRVGQAGGRCLTNSLDDALNKAAEELADQLFGVAVQFPPGGPSTATAFAQQPGQGPQASSTSTTVPAAVAPQGQGGSPPQGKTVPPSVVTQPVDRVSSVTTSPDDPTYAVVIGIRSYREPWPAQGPTTDVSRLVRTLREQVGVPLDHLMVLENELANRLDIEESITQWLSAHADARSVIYLYFVGHAGLDPQSGEVYLAPYDATPADQAPRFVSLRRLQSQLARINPKLALLFLDATVSPLTSRPTGKDRKPVKAVAPNWRAALSNTGEGQGLILQFARNDDGVASPHLLTGLSGSADLDHDGRVTAGELLRSLKSQTVTAPLVSASTPLLQTVLSTLTK